MVKISLIFYNTLTNKYFNFLKSKACLTDPFMGSK